MAILQNRDKEERPWGSFERFTLNEVSTVKIVRVDREKRLSLQFHHHRSEFWRVISGDGIVTINDIEYQARTGDEFEIPAGATHRLAGGEEGIVVLELALGEFDESDIERVADDFGRTSPPAA